MYVLPKEISSSMKFTKSLYLFDIVFVGSVLIIAWALSSLVYTPLIVPYYLFMFTISIILTSKSSINPEKRKFQSIYYALIRNKKAYARE
ncbi:DUF5592 family protein [Clostridium sp.]|jgi:hypothetical protein|uniref:DUF5592 family protein n=1 Tax=Clostridium sp. TaxID=1506 RepID=UPI0025C15D4D|nr:DUF5592 family protein [Clostridium sp.]